MLACFVNLECSVYAGLAIMNPVENRMLLGDMVAEYLPSMYVLISIAINPAFILTMFSEVVIIFVLPKKEIR